MKCEKCGFECNPGDQICINCGNKLPLTNIATVAEIENMNSAISSNTVVEEKKTGNKKVLFIVLICVGLLLIAGACVYFFVLK